MECLDEETILGFCRGGLAPATRTLAEEHIASCDECRVLVSAVARSSFAESDAPDHEGVGIGAETVDARDVKGGVDHDDDDARADRIPGPMLRGRFDLSDMSRDMSRAPTTPIGGVFDTGPQASPVQPGQILAGKFEVERVLGAGGMGIVVAARHTQLGQRVALKFLLPVACEVPGAVARFLREGKAAARITSEHVARVMDTGVLDGGAPYLVMEYLEGSDLGEVVQNRGRIPADDAIEYVLQACEAIVEAHELGIVHRDLKPANLFLSKRADGSPLVKVLDFGISKVEGSGSRSQLTSASVLMGSPRYMSPEQMMSAKDVDARTDVWALGVILFELTTGKSVWSADTMQGLCALIASSPAPLLRTLAPDAPELLEDVVARCLAKSRDDRIASVADLALALEPIAPESARTSIARVLRVARKDRSITTSPRKLPAPPPSPAVAATDPTPAQGASPRIGTWLAVAVGALLVAGIAVNYARPSPDPTPTSAVTTPPTPSLAPSPSPSPSPSLAPSPAPTPSPTPDPAASVAPPIRSGRRPSHTASALAASAAPTTTPTATPTATIETPASAAPSASNRALSDRK